MNTSHSKIFFAFFLAFVLVSSAAVSYALQYVLAVLPLAFRMVTGG